MNGPERIREVLGTALEGEPPNAADAETLVRLGRRRVRARRAMAAAGVMAIAAVLLVGAALVRPLFDDNRTETANTPPTITTSAPDTTAAPSATGIGPGGVTNAQLSRAIANVLKDSGLDGMVVRGSTKVSRTQTAATVSATLADDRGTGTIAVTIVGTSEPIAQLCPPTVPCTPSVHLGQDVLSYAQVLVEPNGLRMYAGVQRDHFRVLAVGTNVASNSTTLTRPSPPVTQGQLADIAARVLNLVHQ